MPHVPAGNITGVYYIVVAGLPWACSWQRLKDFARNQQPDGRCIEIDHAMVYPDSTDGWVRVKGKENFLKAFSEDILFTGETLPLTFSEHLNGGILDDRSLLADGRNETETQTLRDWTTTWPPAASYRDRNGSSSSSHTYSSSTASQYSSPSTYSGSDIDVSDSTYYPPSRLTTRSGTTKLRKDPRTMPQSHQPIPTSSTTSLNRQRTMVLQVPSTRRPCPSSPSQQARLALFILLMLLPRHSSTCLTSKPIHTQYRT
jgi:hypothetical protein